MPEKKAWMKPPWGSGEPQEVEATSEKLVVLMVAGWSQYDPPATKKEEVKKDVHG
jgi:hypothetical protein